MSNFKGTKGSWIIEKIKDKFLITCDNPNWDIASTVTDLPEDEANAKLISCAPEMLEMLENFLSEFEYDNATEYQCELFYKAKELIKKATEL